MLHPLLYDLPVVITSGFGNRVHPITGELKFHNGIDLAVPIGTPVIAPANGYIDSHLENSVGGKQMILQHADGWRTGYAHLDRRTKPAGAQVMKGEIIGYTGNTGASTGPHLHFNVKDPSGSFRDPARIVYETDAPDLSGVMLPEFTVESTRTWWWLVGGLTALGIGYGLYQYGRR